MYIFPNEDDDLTNYTGGSAQVMVPSSLLQAVSKCVYLSICAYILYTHNNTYVHTHAHMYIHIAI